MAKKSKTGEQLKTSIIKQLKRNWQEIVFILAVGALLAEMTGYYLAHGSLDGWDIALFTFTLPIFICLIGQIWWHNRRVSIALSAILSAGSLIFILMAGYFIATTSSELPEAFSMLILGIFLLFSGVTMKRTTKTVQK